MLCFHKYGKVQKDGYQYCSKCGKARSLPCNHDWVQERLIELWGDFGDMPTHAKIIAVCKNCGERKVIKV